MIGLLLRWLHTIGLLRLILDAVWLRLRRLDALRLQLFQLEALWLLLLHLEALWQVLFFLALLRLIPSPLMLMFPALQRLFLGVGLYAHSHQPHRADYNRHHYPVQEKNFHRTPP